MKEQKTKKILVRLTVVVLPVAVLTFCMMNTPEESGEQIAAQSPLQDSRSLLMASTASHEHCESFAGMWYDSHGNLNIGTTSLSIARGRSLYAMYVVKEFSYSLLRNIQSALVDMAENHLRTHNNIYGIIGIEVIPQYNRVEIELLNSGDLQTNESNKDSVRDYLASISLYQPGSLYFFISDEANEEPAFEAPVPQSSAGFLGISPNSTQRPIHGGDRILFYLGEVFRGTITAKATCNSTGRRGIVTNAHVATARERMAHKNNDFYPPFQEIGTRAQYGMRNRIDATFIPFDNPNIWEFTSSAAYWQGNRDNVTVIDRTYKVTHRHEIRVGRYVYTFGQQSGRVRGRIRSVGSWRRVNFRENGGVRSFNDQIITCTRTDGGDSGGPVFKRGRYGRYILVGVNFGGSRFGTRSFSNKIFNVENELGITINARNISLADNPTPDVVVNPDTARFENLMINAKYRVRYGEHWQHTDYFVSLFAGDVITNPFDGHYPISRAWAISPIIGITRVAPHYDESRMQIIHMPLLREPAPDYVRIDFVGEKITGFRQGQTYRVNYGRTFIARNNHYIPICCCWKGTVVPAQRMTGGPFFETLAHRLYVPTRPVINPIGYNPTTSMNINGQIRNISPGMQWRQSTEQNWRLIYAPFLWNLRPGTFYVRQPATATSFASETVRIVISPFRPGILTLPVEMVCNSTNDVFYRGTFMVTQGGLLTLEGLKRWYFFEDGFAPIQNRQLITAMLRPSLPVLLCCCFGFSYIKIPYRVYCSHNTIVLIFTPE